MCSDVRVISDDQQAEPQIADVPTEEQKLQELKEKVKPGQTVAGISLLLLTGDN